MSAARTGAVLALWNDVDPSRVDEYERWHALEHVPERVWVPGFIAATRYVADGSGQPRFFTLYELQSLECLDSAAYRALVHEPTPWSASMRSAFTNFQRVSCPLVVDAGAVIASGMLAVRCVWNTPALPGGAAFQELAAALLSGGDVTRVQIGEAVPAGPQALPNHGNVPPGREFLFLVQSLRDDARVVLRRFNEAAASILRTSAWHQRTTYRFASKVLHTDVTAEQRPAPRLDLMR